MANVVWLTKDEELPKIGEWALVVKDTSARLPTNAQNTFYVRFPHSEAEQNQAIENAKLWADNAGVPTVYVVKI